MARLRSAHHSAGPYLPEVRIPAGPVPEGEIVPWQFRILAAGPEPARSPELVPSDPSARVKNNHLVQAVHEFGRNLRRAASMAARFTFRSNP